MNSIKTIPSLFEEHTPIQLTFLSSAHFLEVFAVVHIGVGLISCNLLWGEIKNVRYRYRFKNSDGLIDGLYGKN